MASSSSVTPVNSGNAQVLFDMDSFSVAEDWGEYPQFAPGHDTLLPSLIAGRLGTEKASYIDYGATTGFPLGFYKMFRGESSFPDVPLSPIPHVTIPNPNDPVVVIAAVGASFSDWDVNPEDCTLERTACNGIEVLPKSLHDLTLDWLKNETGDHYKIVMMDANNDFLRMQTLPPTPPDLIKGMGRGESLFDPDAAIAKLRSILMDLKNNTPTDEELHVFYAAAPFIIKGMVKIPEGTRVVPDTAWGRLGDSFAEKSPFYKPQLTQKDDRTIPDVYAYTQSTEHGGLATPYLTSSFLLEGDVISAAEYDLNLQRTLTFNEKLKTLDDELPFLHVYDFNDVTETIIQKKGYPLVMTDGSTVFIPQEYLTSDDNFHPGPVFNALVANRLLEKMNEVFGDQYNFYSPEEMLALYAQDLGRRPGRQSETEKQRTAALNTFILRLMRYPRVPTPIYLSRHYNPFGE